MRILYLSTSYIPSRRADSVQVMRMCQAMADAGHAVTLTSKGTPSRQERGVADDFAFYGVRPLFQLQKLPRPARFGGGVVHTWHTWRLLRRRREEVDLLFCRDLWGAWLGMRLGYAVLFEAHGLPKGAVSTRLHQQLFAAKNFYRLVLISRALQNEFAALNLLPKPDKIVIAPDSAAPLPAADVMGHEALQQFEHDGKVHIGYVGHLYAGRGIEVIVELAHRLPDHLFHIVGGTEKDLAAMQAQQLPGNLVFHGFVAPGELSAYYRLFDILLMPYQRQVITHTGRSDTSRWMSPMKMFEYMAAGRPIISSDLPVLREVLQPEQNALLVPPDDVPAWETAVRRLVGDKELVKRLGETARQDLLDKYTWAARSEIVLKGLIPE